VDLKKQLKRFCKKYKKYKQFGDQIYFVFRNLSLNDMHTHAQYAVEAAKAAAAQDKF
jgi:hypothetical protein